jgi:hypothetical protein
MKRVLAGLATTVIMGTTMWIGIGRSQLSRVRGTRAEADLRFPDPGFQDPRFQDRLGLQGATNHIEGLLERARNGDGAAYLNAFGGALRARLEREAAEYGRDAFSRRLRTAGSARKSHAIFAPEAEGDQQEAVRITVESTFADRLERQTFHLTRSDRGWLVTDVETARERVTQIPLGSPARFAEPEGVPVAADAFDLVGAAGEE